MDYTHYTLTLQINVTHNPPILHIDVTHNTISHANTTLVTLNSQKHVTHNPTHFPTANVFGAKVFSLSTDRMPLLPC